MLLFLAIATFVMVAFEVVRFALPALNRKFATWFSFVVRKGEERKVTGSTYFLCGALLTALVFPKYIAVPSILFAALGDSMATVIGSWIGKHKIRGKSIEGNLACLAVCLVIGITFSGIYPELSLIMAIAGAVAATIFQALNLPLNDNLTIAPGSAFAMILPGVFRIS
ncbi:MAG: hypothetical protein V1767_04345 [Chloroflexota bacterium]